MELGRVFISSAFKDMFDLRDAAAEAVRLAGLEPVSTEHHVAQHGSVRNALERDIRLCDTYVGIFDRRRGTVPPGDVHAITEQELILARELGLRRLVFLSEVKRSKRDPGLNEFLDAEVTAYSSGVWSRPFKDKDALLREIVAGISSVRPRVVLEIASGAARLFLHGVAPAWTGEAVLGPEPVTLDLSPTARSVLDVFRRGAEDRGRLKEEAVLLLGQELGAAALPGRLGEALGQVLDLAASVGRLVTLEVRTADASALPLPWEMIGVSRHPLPVRSGLVEVVRRIPRSGESGDPSHDPAPTIPDNHLSVLGFTAAPLEDEAVEARIGLGGFASSELFWEKEQDRILIALEGLLRDRRGQLILPDTGEKEALRKYLSQADRPRVIHISCHGGVLTEKDAAPRPVLFLENDEGHRSTLGAEELLSWSRSAPGTAKELALLVLAACSTAGAVGDRGPAPGHRAAVAEALQTGEATGLAERLVSQGFLRVLGMQSTVSDRGATAFAEKLYARLADGADLSQALRAGRVELLSLGLPHEWAVPTLTTRCDAGPLVAPKGSAEPVQHAFEAVRSSFDVAGVSYLEEGYVGRREAERRLRRAFEADRLVAVHGLGGIGKSTLVARFLERRQAEDWRILILGGELAPVTVFEGIAEELGLARQSGVSPEQAEELLRQGIRQALRSGRTALFLDNFEDNQDADGQLKDPALGEALLDLAILGGERFRMLFTSRLPVELGDGPIEVRNLDLGELSPSGCRKLRMLDPDGLGKLLPDAWERVLSHLGGHPKALELLGGYLRGRPDRADQLLADLGPALGAVDARLRSEKQEKGRKLLVQNVLETVPPERRPSLERLCLLEAPLPTNELEALLAAEGIPAPAADLGWLRDHGLLARTVAPSALTGGDAVHRLLASRQREALAEREGPEAARAWHLRVAEHLVERRGPLSDFGLAARHRDAAGDRAGALEMYGQWALSLRDRHAYAACFQIAEEGLQRHPAGENEAEKVGAAKLWVSKHDALEPLGRIDEAESALETAFGLVSEGTSQEAKFHQAGIQMLQGRLLQQEGSVQKAIEKLEASQRGFEEGGHPRERAVALGGVARLRAQAGDVDGALTLHEERLQIFESLGDVSSRAVTLGDVARLRAQAGDVDGALKLHEEELKTYESLGDMRSRAVTLRDVARLQAQSGDGAGALKLHEEGLQIFESLGDVRERAVTLGDLARLRAQAGDGAGALKLHEERLQIFRGLGDIEGVAGAQYYLADLDAAQGNTSQALERLAESWALFCRIGRADAIAVVGQLYGLLLASADRTRALETFRRSRDAFELLGMAAEVAEMDQVIRRIENPEPAAEEA